MSPATPSRTRRRFIATAGLALAQPGLAQARLRGSEHEDRPNQ